MKNALENFRTAHGLTFRQLAMACGGRSLNAVYRHCKGEKIAAESALLYSRALGIPRSELRPDLWPPDAQPEGGGEDGCAAGLPSVCPAAGDVSASKSAGCGDGGGGRGDRAAEEDSPAGATRRKEAACTITRP